MTRLILTLLEAGLDSTGETAGILDPSDAEAGDVRVEFVEGVGVDLPEVDA